MGRNGKEGLERNGQGGGCRRVQVLRGRPHLTHLSLSGSVLSRVVITVVVTVYTVVMVEQVGTDETSEIFMFPRRLGRESEVPGVRTNPFVDHRDFRLPSVLVPVTPSDPYLVSWTSSVSDPSPSTSAEGPPTVSFRDGSTPLPVSGV